MIALAALLVIDAVFVLVGELEDVGRGEYDMIDAFRYVLLVLPSRAYELFPSAGLIGALLGLGALSARSEVVAMRSAGISRTQMAWASVLGASFVLMPIWLSGEMLAPDAEQKAQQMRVIKQEQGLAITAPGDAEGSGFWIRVGERFIHVRQVLGLGLGGDSLQLQDVLVYGFDGARLAWVEHAERGYVDGDRWLLENVQRTTWSGGETPIAQRLSSRHEAELIDPELLEVVVVKPRYLASFDLWRYANYLQRNGLDARQYQVAFWSRMMYPFTALAMVFAAMPFVFGSVRQGGVGQRLFVGVVVGLGFYVFQRTAVSFGDVYQLNPMLSAATPTAVLLAAVSLVLRRGQ